MDEDIALDAASDAFEMGSAYFGSMALDESRQQVNAGWVEERRVLLAELGSVVATMPSGDIFGVPVGQVKQRFSAYHSVEVSRLDKLSSEVLDYETERYEQIQEQEALDTLPWEIQLAVGAFSDIADVGFILREWHITGDFPAFDSIVTLLPIINAGMRRAGIGGLNLTDIMAFFRHSDEMVGATDEIADVSEIINHIQRKAFIKPDTYNIPETDLIARVQGDFYTRYIKLSDQKGLTYILDEYSNLLGRPIEVDDIVDNACAGICILEFTDNIDTGNEELIQYLELLGIRPRVINSEGTLASAKGLTDQDMIRILSEGMSTPQIPAMDNLQYTSISSNEIIKKNQMTQLWNDIKSSLSEDTAFLTSYRWEHPDGDVIINPETEEVVGTFRSHTTVVYNVTYWDFGWTDTQLETKLGENWESIAGAAGEAIEGRIKIKAVEMYDPNTGRILVPWFEAQQNMVSVIKAKK